MAQQALGMFDVTGSEENIALIRRALSRTDPKPSTFLDSRVKVIFTRDLPKRGDGGPSWAYNTYTGTIKINPDLTPAQKVYSFLHEVGHEVDRQHLSGRKRRELMEKMTPKPSFDPTQPNRGWVAGPYRQIAAEAFAESFVAMISDVTPLNRTFFQRRVTGLDGAVKILERVDVKPPEEPPEEPPPPIEEPGLPPAEEPDGCADTIAELEAAQDRIVELENTVGQQQQAIDALTAERDELQDAVADLAPWSQYGHAVDAIPRPFSITGVDPDAPGTETHP